MDEQGDIEDLEGFVRELTGCQDELFLFIRTLCGDPHAAADIRQAVNMILWRKRRAFTPGTNFRAWAWRIAHLEVKSFHRRGHSRRMVPLDPELLDRFAAEMPVLLDELPARRLALARCMERLTAKDNELLRHRYWAGGSLESLAKATGRSVGTLKARLFQLRAALRRCIEENLPHIQA